METISYGNHQQGDQVLLTDLNMSLFFVIMAFDLFSPLTHGHPNEVKTSW